MYPLLSRWNMKWYGLRWVQSFQMGSYALYPSITVSSFNLCSLFNSFSHSAGVLSTISIYIFENSDKILSLTPNQLILSSYVISF